MKKHKVHIFLSIAFLLMSCLPLFSQEQTDKDLSNNFSVSASYVLSNSYKGAVYTNEYGRTIFNGVDVKLVSGYTNAHYYLEDDLVMAHISGFKAGLGLAINPFYGKKINLSLFTMVNMFHATNYWPGLYTLEFIDGQWVERYINYKTTRSLEKEIVAGFELSVHLSKSFKLGTRLFKSNSESLDYFGIGAVVYHYF